MTQAYNRMYMSHTKRLIQLNKRPEHLWIFLPVQHLGTGPQNMIVFNLCHTFYRGRLFQSHYGVDVEPVTHCCPMSIIFSLSRPKKYLLLTVPSRTAHHSF